jgi:leucyl/phenylalanyl-tRNA--protein transferase
MSRAGDTGRPAAIDPGLLLRAYSIGVFPMADSRDAPDIYWVEPKRRGVLPLDGFHLSRSLAKTIRSDRFTVTADADFAAVIAGCAEERPVRPETWINPQITDAYVALHRQGHAHSVEVWHQGALVGGLYGVVLGAAFFGESMFSRMTDASKVALAHLVARLKVGGFRLLDCQFITDHLASLGAVEISRAAYVGLLDAALAAGGVGAAGRFPSGPSPVDFFALDRAGAPAETGTVSGPISGWRIVQALGQTS